MSSGGAVVVFSIVALLVLVLTGCNSSPAPQAATPTVAESDTAPAAPTEAAAPGDAAAPEEAGATLDEVVVGLNRAQAHSIDFVRAAASPEAFDALIRGAKAEAATAIDLLTNPVLLEQIKQAYQSAG